MKQSLIVLQYMSSILWIISGILTAGSVFRGEYIFVLNIVIGVIFMLIGVYIFWKEKHFLLLFQGIPRAENSKVLLGELIFLVCTFLLGLIILSAVYSRVFVEGFAVFG